MSELKTCPFCGVVPEAKSRTDNPPYTENTVVVHYIKCENSACVIRPGTACNGEWGMPKSGQLSNDEAMNQVIWAWNHRQESRNE